MRKPYQTIKVMGWHRTEVALTCIAILTIAAIFIQPHLIQYKTLEIVAKGSAIEADINRGGVSYGVINKDAANQFDCILGFNGKIAKPYCGYSIGLSSNHTEGIDMSKYESITLDIDYTGDSKTMRFYMRNYNSHYSTPDDSVSTKYQIVEFETDLLDKPIEIAFDSLHVPAWWVLRYKVPFRHQGRDRENISILQVQTGGYAPLGTHSFTINSMKLKRQIIPDRVFYYGLSFTWLMMSLVLLASTWYSKNRQLLQEKLKSIDLAKKTEKLSRESKTDLLTGLLNRRGIEIFVNQAFDQFDNHQQTFSIVLFDTDYFKKVNDNYGHSVGDRVLQQLSEVVSKTIRDQDKFARWGGEEFLILCNCTSIQDVHVLADKIKAAIESFVFTRSLHITCSFGLATSLRGDTKELLIERADAALYDAKRAGRNCIKAR